jgi:hypothetical protein
MGLKVRNRSTEANGDRYVGGYYVSETLTTGIPTGTLVFVTTDNKSVLIADQANDLPAMGIIYNADVRDARLAYSDNPEGDAMPRTKGGKSMEMEKKATVDVIYTTAKTYFRMKDETLTGTVTTAGGTTMTGLGSAFLTELKVGDYVVVAGETVRQVDVVTSDTVATVSVAFSNTAGTLAVTGKSMKNKPVYLGENGTSSKYGKLNATVENLTVLKPIASSGDSYQLVGFIDGTKIIHIDLTKQLEIATA